jgi:hypothetical protein
MEKFESMRSGLEMKDGLIQQLEREKILLNLKIDELKTTSKLNEFSKIRHSLTFVNQRTKSQRDDEVSQLSPSSPSRKGRADSSISHSSDDLSENSSKSYRTNAKAVKSVTALSQKSLKNSNEKQSSTNLIAGSKIKNKNGSPSEKKTKNDRQPSQKSVAERGRPERQKPSKMMTSKALIQTGKPSNEIEVTKQDAI